MRIEKTGLDSLPMVQEGNGSRRTPRRKEKRERRKKSMFGADRAVFAKAAPSGPWNLKTAPMAPLLG